MRNPWEDERVQLGAIALASVSIVAFLTSLASQTLTESERPVVAPPPAKLAEPPKNTTKQEIAPPVAEAPPSPPGPPAQEQKRQEQTQQEQTRQEQTQQEAAGEERPSQEQSGQASPQKEPAPQEPQKALRQDDEVVAAIRPSLPLEPTAPAQSPDTAVETRLTQEPAAAAAPSPAERRGLKKRKPVFFKPAPKRKTWVGALPHHKSSPDEPEADRSGLQLLY